MKELAVLVLASVMILTSGAAFAEKLYVGTDTAFVPFEYKGKDGKYTGFDIELWAEIAKRLGVEYELKPMDFNGLIPGLVTGNLEVVTGGADAAMHDTPNVLYYIRTAGNGRVKAVGPDVKAAQYGIAFPQGSALRDKVNVALLQMMEDGAYADLFRKWFDADPQ